jgi:putative Holliday junction resolvase
MANVQAILTIAKNEQTTEIVVGLPISLDGNIHQQGQIVKDFCDLLKKQTTIEIHTVDERYSSAEAKSFLIASGISPSKNRDQLNAAAAAIILQRWLDNEKRQS